MRWYVVGVAVAAAAMWGGVQSSGAGQPLETETARIGTPGTVKIEMGFEHQSAHEGTESNVPIAIEYVPAKRLELLLEPVVFSRIADGTSARGLGDLEGTALFLVRAETTRIPAIAVAGEVKLPTAHSRLIGSGETDYTGYLVLSKRIGSVDLHANAAYAVIGKPRGIDTNNVSSFAVAAERKLGRFEAVAEVLGSTAALAEGSASTNGESVTAPEIGGEELVGTLGGRYRVNGSVVLSLGVSYDNNHAVLVHPGVSLAFQ